MFGDKGVAITQLLLVFSPGCGTRLACSEHE
jgi:hypothetical protein